MYSHCKIALNAEFSRVRGRPRPVWPQVSGFIQVAANGDLPAARRYSGREICFDRSRWKSYGKDDRAAAPGPAAREPRVEPAHGRRLVFASRGGASAALDRDRGGY